MLGDFNGWVGVKRDGYENVLGTFGDERVNDNGKCLLEVCLEWNLLVTNTMFQHKKIHMYTRAEGSLRSMIDFVIVDERLGKKVLDTRAYCGVGIDTDHFLVVSRIGGLFTRWRYRVKKPVSVLERIKVENLQKTDVKNEYVSKLIERFDGLDEVCRIEDLWKLFKEGMVEVATDMCEVSKRKKGLKTRNVCLDEDVRNVLSDKKKAWLDWLSMKANERIQKATKEDINVARKEYKRIKDIAKDVVGRKKECQKDEFDRRLSDDFQSNIKWFWKSLRTARGKTTTSQLQKIRGHDGSIVKGEECVLKRWKEY
ncbi:uncharacterized protein LOC113239183 [Hyposmocoma kahamanoa]|uniref:uncharacterized protein LOC113239183 n=1 Tax=Hyposmocoma kahamanoa TaxID=1477025 RepID=UPI000E6D81CD|nr:uncharacterized protein LOC113239183 [Hyposmocoma kahamanoa]